MVHGFKYGPTRGARDGPTAHAHVHTTVDQEPERHEPRPAWISFIGPCPSDPLTSEALPPQVSRTFHNRTMS